MQVDFARPLFGREEKEAVNRVMESHWLASGEENISLEREWASYHQANYALAVNSGSSANLLALAALNLPKGSRVLTSGCGFPATLSPILHLGLEPVLVDYDLATHNINVAQVLEQMPKVKAVIFAHTMGIPVDMNEIYDAAILHDVRIIEDCCEAAGAWYGAKPVGSFDLGTYSFYPSHQITALGGGGMVTFKDKALYDRARSLRDWGKSYSEGYLGDNPTKFNVEIDGIPYFNHYAYSTIGWNFKLPEANAAFCREQLKKLGSITNDRQANHDYIWNGVNKECFVNIEHIGNPSPFGVTLTFKEPEEGRRDKFSQLLMDRGVRHRPFFAGNITRHDPFRQFYQEFPVADYLMKHSLFVGCYAGLKTEEMDYMINAINESISLL